MNFLDRIVARKREEIRTLHASVSQDTLQSSMSSTPPVVPVKEFLRKQKRVIIAEIKRESPSKGVLDESLDPYSLAGEYTSAGASAISVLTDRDFFGGRPEDLQEARRGTGVPLLRKDFLLDELQVYESRSLGADVVLLIVRLLTPQQLAALIAASRKLGMEPLVEVHTRDEVLRAVDSGATLVGVNNRDLDTFELSLDTAIALRDSIPSNMFAVAESGIRSPAEARMMFDAGYDGVLIGEGLVKSGDRAAFIAEARRG